jgi:hypothetical protein
VRHFRASSRVITILYCTCILLTATPANADCPTVYTSLDEHDVVYLQESIKNELLCCCFDNNFRAGILWVPRKELIATAIILVSPAQLRLNRSGKGGLAEHLHTIRTI